MPRHILTREERKRGGQAGFRKAVENVQGRYMIDFNDAVCWLKRRIGWQPKSKR